MNLKIRKKNEKKIVVLLTMFQDFFVKFICMYVWDAHEF